MSNAQGKYLIKNVNIITMENDSILYNHSISVEGGRIVDIFPANTSGKYKKHIQIDGTNKYVIPGLFDMHMHFVSDDRIATKYLETEAIIPIVYGVTTARIMIGKPEHLILRKKIGKGEIIAPKLFIASPQLTGVSFGKRLNGQVIKTYEQAHDAVIEYKKEGYDFIKLTFDLNDNAYRGVIDAAELVNIPVVGHVSRNVRLNQSLESGQHIEHLDQYMDAIISDKAPTQTGLSAFGLFQKKSWETINFIDSLKLEFIIQKTVDYKIWNTPTNHFFVSSFARKKEDENIQNSPEWNWFSEEVRDELLSYRIAYWNQASEKQLRDKYIQIRGYIIKELFKRSGRIMAGSDAPEWLNLYGTGLHRELESMVHDVGLMPYEALQTATTQPSEFLNLTDHGKILPGYIADIVILNKNPLENIRYTKDIFGVLTQGKFMSKDFLEDKLASTIGNLNKAKLEDE